MVLINLMVWKFLQEDFSEVTELYEILSTTLDVDIFCNPLQVKLNLSQSSTLTS